MQLREQIRYKIVKRLDEIERMVKQQVHLSNPEKANMFTLPNSI